MKISFVLGHELPFPPTHGGGVNSLLDSLTCALAAAGHAVTAYSPIGKGKPSRETIKGVVHVRLKGAERSANNLQNALRGLPYALRVRAALEECDILSCHMLHSFVFTRINKAKAVTHTIHRDPKKFLMLYSFLDRIYTASESVSSQARMVAPSIASKVKTVYNCVDFEGYNPPRLSTSSTTRFIFVGRFSEDKGVDVLIRAFCNAARQCDSIHLETVGPMARTDGGDENLAMKMREIVESHGLGARIVISPPVFDRAGLDDRIRSCDVVCLPSVRGETLNMSIIESMRLGKCLLVSDLPANVPLVKSGYNGLFAKVGDEDNWCEQILYLARNRDKGAEYGMNAYQYGLQTFSASRVAADYIHDFESLLSKSR